MTQPRTDDQYGDNESVESCAELSTMPELDAAIAESFDRPVFVLKHSDSCGRSEHAMHTAFRELERWAHGVVCHMVVVQESRGLSDAIERRFKIRHETPQLLLFRNGRLVWHASHWGITDAAMRKALAAATESAS